MARRAGEIGCLGLGCLGFSVKLRLVHYVLIVVVAALACDVVRLAMLIYEYEYVPATPRSILLEQMRAEKKNAKVSQWPRHLP